MAKFFYKIIGLTFSVLTISAVDVYSQCTNSFAEGTPAAFNGNWQNMSVGSGTYTNFNVVNGRIYSFRHSSLPAAWGNNSQITLASPGSSILAYNDNNGPYFSDNCTGGELNASIDYVATFNGVLRVHTNRSNCAGYQGAGSANSAILQYKETVPTSLSFGNNQWNVFATVGTNLNLGPAYGFYTDPNISLTTAYNSSLSPSSAAGWSGTEVPIDNFTVSARRQGFPCGMYQINVNNHDDNFQLYVNGVLIQSLPFGTNMQNAWSGFLNASSTVELRCDEGCGGSYMQVDIVNITAPVSGGQIGNDQSVCEGTPPATINDLVSPSGGAGPYSYNWFAASNCNGSYNSIGNNNPAFSPGVLPNTACFYRVATDQCGNAASSNTVQITVTPAPLWYLDADGDGHSTGSPVSNCNSPGAGYTQSVVSQNDCDDNDATVWQSNVLFIDNDADGYDAGTVTLCYGAAPPAGYNLSTSGADCDDQNPMVNVATTWYLDADNDGFYVSSIVACTNPGTGYNTTAATFGDCDDANNAVWQSATLFIDADADGYDNGTATICYGASVPNGYSGTSNGSDCNDADPSVFELVSWYLDVDNDGYHSGSQVSCNSPGAGWNTTSNLPGDCNDADPAVNPGANEIYCDGIDQNCNGMADEYSSDNIPPTISGCPANIQLTAPLNASSMPVYWVTPIVSDNCAMNTFTGNFNPGDNLPLGTTVVTYTATDMNNNVSTCSFTVTVCASVGFIVTNLQVACPQFTATLVAQTAGTGYSYQWYKNGVAIAGAIGPSRNINDKGNYHVVITSGSCSSVSPVQYVDLGTPTLNADGFVYKCPGSSYTMSVSPSSLGTAYQWRISGTAIPGATSSSYTTATVGNYTCNITYMGGCTKLAGTIKLRDVNWACKQGMEAEAFDTNEQTDAFAAMVYPNPSDGNFTLLRRESSDEMEVRVVNMLGEVIRQLVMEPGDSETSINLQGEAEGMYLLMLNKGSQTETIRISLLR